MRQHGVEDQNGQSVIGVHQSSLRSARPGVLHLPTHVLGGESGLSRSIVFGNNYPVEVVGSPLLSPERT